MPAALLPDGRSLPIGNIYCIGRNYVRHIEELGNEVPTAPVVFMKPTSAVLQDGGAIELPSFSHDVHHEVELTVLIGRTCRDVAPGAALACAAGYGVGLDLTARDTQDALKAKGLPWLVSKGFDTSACLSSFLSPNDLPEPSALRFSLDVNGVRRQHGETARMIHSVPALIAHLSGIFTLQAGDVLFTGTPEGVAAIAPGDRLVIALEDRLRASFTVAACPRTAVGTE
jgi:2-keto-4-pentenoate hydratase/2-oxohepta-3-ene-1,7-dioic acid hydratase in catechol pathway